MCVCEDRAKKGFVGAKEGGRGKAPVGASKAAEEGEAVTGFSLDGLEMGSPC